MSDSILWRAFGPGLFLGMLALPSCIYLLPCGENAIFLSASLVGTRQNWQRSEYETSSSNICATEMLSLMAGGGGCHEDGLQDDVKIWGVRGEKGADMTERAIRCGGGSGESRGLKAAAVRERFGIGYLEGL